MPRLYALGTALFFWVLAVLAFGTLYWVKVMPNRSGSIATVVSRPALEERLKAHVKRLSHELGPRTVQGDRYPALAETADWIERYWRDLGYTVEEQPFSVLGHTTRNLWVTVPGANPELPMIVVGAHYDTDSWSETPGADDNASGIATLLELSRALRGFQGRRTIQLVAFTTEEAPHFQTKSMGSLRFARALAGAGKHVELMISLECVGYFREEPGSQQYPPILRPFYPNVGNFVALVGRLGARSVVSRVARVFGQHVALPFESAALPSSLEGVGWSDHWAFWYHGYEALMITDTAPFRNPHYHRPSDTWDTLNYRVMGALAEGLVDVVRELAWSTPASGR